MKDRLKLLHRNYTGNTLYVRVYLSTSDGSCSHQLQVSVRAVDQGQC